jgi:DNA processing protein
VFDGPAPGAGSGAKVSNGRLAAVPHVREAPGDTAARSPAPPVVPAEIVRARAYLSRVAEPPASALVRFVEAVGPVAAACRVRAGEVPDAVAAETAGRRVVDRAHADLAAAHTTGARLLVPEDPAWPHWAFAPLAISGAPDLAPPVALWVRGPVPLDQASERAVAVVGARAATGYGAHVAGDFASAFAVGGATVVSGAAIGIDGAAHRGALAVDGITVAVLACGIDRAYPAAHAALLGRIATSGLVVSEYPPGSVPARHRFLVRNRLIAALGAGTLVVEAGVRSGAQRTAGNALALGRSVMAVPGPITSALSDGCHRLIQNGALLVTRPEEVLEVVGRLGLDLAPDPATPLRPTDRLEGAVALVHDALPARGARDARWLAREAGVPPDAVRAALTELERRGLARYRDGLWLLAGLARRG